MMDVSDPIEDVVPLAVSDSSHTVSDSVPSISDPVPMDFEE